MINFSEDYFCRILLIDKFMHGSKAVQGHVPKRERGTI